MPQATQQRTELPDLPEFRIDIDDRRNPPHLGSDQRPWGESSFSDAADPLFSMYVKMSEEEDNKMAERWKADADGILIFTGLFSASVATLSAVSVQDLRPNPQDISTFYLGNIYQLLADLNTGTSTASHPFPVAKPPIFSPPRYAVWVNSLWFLSLVISLTCALLATLMRQWAHRYLSITQPPRYRPHKRARIRAFVADGVDKLHLPWAVEVLPALLHLSLFLFFFGLLIYLFNIDHTVFNITIWWVGLSVGVYTCITFMPIFRHDSPYHTPLSTSVWFLCHGVAYITLQTCCVIYRVLRFPDNPVLRALKYQYLQYFSVGIGKTVEDTALKLSQEIYPHVFDWTLNALDEDHELEQFFEGIPGLLHSQVVEVPETVLKPSVSFCLNSLYFRTMSSNLSSDSVKQRRLVTCLRATRAVYQSVEEGHVLNDISLKHNDTNKELSLFLQTEIATIITCAQERDDQWFALAMDQFGVSERVLRLYLVHGNSVLLANLIQITGKLYDVFVGTKLRLTGATWLLLKLLTQFDPRNTLPELQHDFCALWNKIIQVVQDDESNNRAFFTLYAIRHIYIVLHQGTKMLAPAIASTSTNPYDDIFFQASSYPLCDIPGHRRPYLALQPPEVGNQGTIFSTTTTPSTVAHHISIPTALFPSTRLDLSSFSVPDPDNTNPGPHPAEESLSDRDCLTLTTSGMTTGRVIQGTTVISSPASSEHRSTPRQGVVPQQTELSPITPHSVVSSVSPAPILIQTFSGMVTGEPPLSSDPITRSDYASHELELDRLPSTPTSAVLSAAQAASVSYPDVSTRTASLCSSGPSQNPDPLSPAGLLHRPNPLHASAPDIAIATLQSNEDPGPWEDLDPQHGINVVLGDDPRDE